MRLLALFLLTVGYGAGAVTNITMLEIQPGILSMSVSNTSADDVRIQWDTTTAFTNRYWRGEVTSGATKHLVVGSGWIGGTTIYLQVQEDSGGGYADVDCSGSGVAFDGTPEVGGGSALCTGPYITVSLPADDGMSPAAPTGVPNGSIANPCQGTVLTASSCADIQTDFDTLKALAGDGNSECIEIPWSANWRDCSALDFSTGVTNTDDIVITSDRWDDNRCPKEHETLLQGDVGQCAPTLSKNGTGTFITLGANVWLDRLHISTPPRGSSVYGEGGAFTTANNSADLDLAIVDHGFDTSRPLIVTSDPNDVPSCTITGVYQTTTFSLPNPDTVRLTGQTGGLCPGGHVYQDPYFYPSGDGLIELTSTAKGGIARSFIEAAYPARLFGLITNVSSSSPSEFAFVQNTIHYGTWGSYDASDTWLRPSVASADHSTTSIYRAGVASNILVRDIVQIGNGIAWFVDNGATPTDWVMHRVLHGFPLEWNYGESEDAADGIVGLGISGRGYTAEFKRLIRGQFYGVGQYGVLKAPNNGTTPVSVLGFRNIPNGSNGISQGISDIDVRSVANHRAELVILAEGASIRGLPATLRGRFKFDNILMNEPEENAELDYTDSAEHANHILSLGGGGIHKASLTRFTRWKGDGVGGFIAGGSPITGSYVRVEKGVLAAEPMRLNGFGKMIFRNSQGRASGSNPQMDIDTVNQSGAVAFARSFDRLGNGSSYMRDIVIAGGQRANGGSYDAAGMTLSEVNAETTGAATQDVKVYNSLSTINLNVDAIGCDADFDCGDDGGVDEAHDGDEGFNKDEWFVDARQLATHTGKSHPLAGERVNDDTIRFFARAPTTDEACTLRWRAVGASSVWSETTAVAGSRDRSADLTGSAGTEYDVTFRCEGPDALYTRATPGSAP